MDITKQELCKIFYYLDGKIFWKTDRGTRAKAGEEAGSACSTNGYRLVQLDGKAYRVHRIIYMMHYGFVPEFLDHINNNRLDNRIENLRQATIIQNNQNKKTPKSNTSGIKNINWHKKANKWCVRVGVSSKRIHIGYFDDIELAELVAIEARNKYHGQFANPG